MSGSSNQKSGGGVKNPFETAVKTFDKDVCVFAGAGSGKTTLLVKRFLYAVMELGVEPDRILTITFTDKAANEMKARLVDRCNELGLDRERQALENAYISTIHSFCARVLKENPIEGEIDPFFQVLSSAETEILASKVLDRLFETDADNPKWIELLCHYGEDAVRAAIKDFYDTCRAMGDNEGRLLEPRGEEEAWAEPLKSELRRMTLVFKQAYENEKRRMAVCDFEDLLFMVYQLFSSNVPKKQAVLGHYREHFHSILVDEYQDTSPLQARIIGLLKNGHNLFAVGDAQQAIYAFRHADPEVFKSLVEPPAKNIEKIILSDNYRSRPAVLDFINRVSSQLIEKFIPLKAKKKEVTKNEAIDLICVRRDKEMNLEAARRVEASILAQHIRSLADSGSYAYGQIAVLFKKTTASHFYERAFRSQDIPYFTARGRGFYEKQEVADLLNLLKLIEGSSSDIVLAGVLRSPLVGISDDALYWLSKKAKDQDDETPLILAFDSVEDIHELTPADKNTLIQFWKWLGELKSSKNHNKIYEILRQILEVTYYDAKILAEEEGVQKLANVRKLIAMAESMDRRGLSIEDFTRFLDGLAQRETEEAEARIHGGGENSVLFSSIHAAKGLEFPCVVIADMGGQENRFSSSLLLSGKHGLGIRIKNESDKWVEDASYQAIREEDSAKAAEENKRLLYVAMTRAQERLVLSGSVALDAKLGGIKKDGAWMSSVLSVLGPDLNKEGVREIHLKADDEKIEKPQKAEPVLMKEADTRSKLALVQKDYDEVQDATVTDLVTASMPKKEWME